MRNEYTIIEEIISHDITTANAEFNAPRTYTDFIEDGIGIDPEGCGCTDCIVGHSIPFSDENSEKIALAAFQAIHEERKIVNRLNGEVTLSPFKDGFTYGFIAS